MFFRLAAGSTMQACGRRTLREGRWTVNDPRPTPSREEFHLADPGGGRPPKHGGEFVFGDPATWGTEQAVTVTDTRLYGKATVQAWDQLHPRLTRRAAGLDHHGRCPSNESFGGWTKTFTDPRLCAAIVDRLTFNASSRPEPTPTASPPPEPGPQNPPGPADTFSGSILGGPPPSRAASRHRKHRPPARPGVSRFEPKPCWHATRELLARRQWRCIPSWFAAASTVCASRTAMVIGPTPPGTGVIRRARVRAVS